MLNLCCQICSTYFSISIFGMLQHLMEVHRHDSKLHFTCEVLHCLCTFTKIDTYKSHLSRKHKDVDLKLPYTLETANNNASLEDEDRPVAMEENMEVDEPIILLNQVEVQKHNIALYVLKTKEDNLLSQTCVDNVVEDTSELVKTTVQTIKKGLKDCLDDAGIEFNTVPGLEDLFSEDNAISKPFEHVSTKYKQHSYFKQHFGLVEPERITLGHSSIRRRSGTRYKEVLKDDEIIYIPLLETLEKMLNIDSILTEVRNGHQHHDGIIEDICDGQLFKAHPLFSVDSTALQLLLYYDELEVVNPLGTKTGKHKLGVYYFTLGNIPPKHRSQINAIQLLVLTTTPMIKKYGIDTLIEPFMDDLKYLERDGGYQFMIKGEPQFFSGTIVFVSGDNLGSQLVGGYKVGPGAFLKCRHCMGTSDDIKKKFLEKYFTLCTRDGHDQHCQLIDQDEGLSKTYGVCYRSILCNSRYYHVVDGMPGDAMHDVLEGVLQYGCKEMLKVFIFEEKYFTLEQLNERLKTFDYGYYNDQNKPSPINRQTMKNDNNSLKQKAAQMWCMGTFLPLIIGATVPEDDERWQHFLLLVKIVDIVFSPMANIANLSVLEGLIEEYLWGFTHVYHGRSVIPKMHYLIHYPAHIFRFGPMVRTWCMRYEAKHRYFKQIAGCMGNFTHVALTLAEQHQAQMCYRMNTQADTTTGKKSNFLIKQPTIGHGNQVVVGNTEYFNVLKQSEETLAMTDFLYELRKVAIHGTEYRIGAVVCIGLSNNHPQFDSIEKIVVFSLEKIYFILTKLVTIAFASHFNAFEVRRPINSEIVALLQNQFQTYLPSHTIKPSTSASANGILYVAPRCSFASQY